MRRNKSTIKLSLPGLLVMLLLTEILLFGHFYTVQAAAATRLADKDIMFIPEISIGGLFQKTGIAVNGSTLGNYINTFYLWAIRAVTVLAIFMVMLAGIRWITANGNASTIGTAKSQMTDAIVGLILILCANLILNTINPALTTLKPIQVQQIQKIEFEKPELDPGESSQDALHPPSAGTITRIFVHYSESSFGDAAQIDQWHRNATPPYSQIAYNYVILNGHRTANSTYNASEDGLIETGRPENIMSAATGGCNYDSLSVVFIGDKHGLGFQDSMTANQLASLKTIINSLRQKYNIPANRVYGHMECRQGTDCPGFTNFDTMRSYLSQ